MDTHIAVALDLPHVQIYNFDTAWRTGPLGNPRQRAVVARVVLGGAAAAIASDGRTGPCLAGGAGFAAASLAPDAGAGAP